MIETRRTTIRPIRASDESDLFDIYSRPEVFEHFGKGVYSKKEHIDSVNRALDKWESSRKGELVAEFEGSVIARLIFFPDHSDEYEIGYVINPKLWRMGFASEVAEGLVIHAFELGATKVVACARETNVVSLHILKKLNFTETHSVLGDDGINRLWLKTVPIV